MLTQYVDSYPMNEKILKAIEMGHKCESLKQFIENSIRVSGICQQRLGNVFQLPQQRASQILKNSRTESNFVLKSISKMGCWHQGDPSP